MNFMLGCNYWASHAGTEMWKNWCAEQVDKDLYTLSKNGVSVLRIFPLWRDFQPVCPHYTACGELEEYALPDGESDPYFLSSEQMAHFTEVLSLCKKYNIKVIIGLLTGWMSGGLFIPTALYGKDLITDPTAQYFEQLFIKGFVTHFKNDETIIAWDLGNECNCMSPSSARYQTAAWTAMVANAIRSADPSRPVISGMHGLHLDRNWTIEDQAMFTDMLTTHPYPYFVKHSRNDPLLSFRTTLLATAQSKFYAEISGKPCLCEEMGTLGPMLCSNDNAGAYFRVNLFSLWANGVVGALWWCAHDQTELTTHPYSTQMIERELGLLDTDLQPKPALKELSRFADWMSGIDFTLPKAESDAVCLITKGQRDWGVGYMTYALMRKIGRNLTFADAAKELPDAPLYLMPSVKGGTILPLERYQQLKQKVYEGADLYLSIDNCILSQFKEFTGLEIVDSYETPRTVTADIAGVPFKFQTSRTFMTRPTSAKVLAADQDGYPLLACNSYGKGHVYTLMAPMEDALIDRHDAFEGQEHLLYSDLFGEKFVPRPLQIDHTDLALTYHYDENGAYVVLINHSENALQPNLTLSADYTVDQVYYGSLDSIAPFDACVVYLKKK